MTTEQKFKAAVNVIRNLPPKGKQFFHVSLIGQYYVIDLSCEMSKH